MWLSHQWLHDSTVRINLSHKKGALVVCLYTIMTWMGILKPREGV